MSTKTTPLPTATTEALAELSEAAVVTETTEAPVTVAPSMTPYAASKIANAVLLEKGIDKVLPAQMFYNYTSARIRAGKNPFIACDADGKITVEGLQAWLTKYITKNFAAQA